MELEPNSSKKSFDVSECKIERQLRKHPQACANYPSAFDTPWDIGMASQFSTASFHDGYLGIDPNSIELSSFFDTLTNALSAAGSDVPLGHIDNDSINALLPSGEEDVWRQAETNFPSFHSEPRTYPHERTPSNAPCFNPDYSLSLWADSEPNNLHVLAPQENFWFTDFNASFGPTPPERSQECQELIFCPRANCTLLDYDNALPAPLPQHIADGCGPIRSLCGSNQDGKCLGNSLALPLNDMAAPKLNHDHFENQEDTDQSLCVKPADLALSPFDRHPSQRQHPRDQAFTSDGDLLITVNINSSQANLRSPLPTLDDLILNFDLNPKPPPSKRKRSSFDTAGKEKVRLVRDWGACVICRSRKISCSATEVCKQCERTVDDPRLAKQICMRTRMQDIYIGVKALHGPSLEARKARLQPFLASLVGEPQDITISLSSEAATTCSTVGVRLQVKQCSISPQCRWKSLKKVRGIYVTSEVLEDEHYIIVPSTLPGIAEFDDFGRNILSMSAGSLSGSMTRLLDDFLFRYSSRASPSRLRHLSNSTARIASLSNFVSYGFLNLQDGSYDLLEHLSNDEGEGEHFVSETVHDQIRLLAAEGLEPEEKHVFSEFDELSKIISAGNHARIIAGICLLRLLLLYRDRLIRDQIRLELPRTKKYHQYRLEKSAFMYRRLTVAYGTLCREHDSPLTMNWEDEENNEDTRGSEELKLLFSQLRQAFRRFCHENLTGQYDDVFKSLIAEPIKGRKTRKRRRLAK